MCAQPGAMHWLAFFLDAPSARGKTPCVVLVTNNAATHPDQLHPEDICGAALVFEYKVLGLGTGLYSTDDSSGLRAVIARDGESVPVCAAIVRTLLRAGAQIVLLTCDARVTVAEPQLNPAGFRIRYALRQRPVARTLPLRATFSETLAQMGKATRFNLGYYRRRLARRMTCEFVADARTKLTPEAMQALNVGSLNAVSVELSMLRYQAACQLPGGFLVGLREAVTGTWLSVIGGWRQAGATVLYWQTNASGYERDSLGTVMRSYFLEHEIALGGKSVSFYGGTTHSMQHSFCKQSVFDLVVRQRSWRARAIVGAARCITAVQRRMHRVNFIAEALSDRTLRWRAVSAPSATPPERCSNVTQHS
jgi:hypothetical protein